MPHPASIPFELREDHIELSQLLKATGACDSGGAAKHAIQGGDVTVNGAKELRRGHKLHAGDVVLYRGKTYEVLAPRSRPPGSSTG